MEPWWKFATFFLNLSIDYDRNQAFSHFWSLCIEEHFYLIFPMPAWIVIRPARSANPFWAIATVVLAGIALRTTIWLHDAAIAGQRNWFVEDIYYPTWNRLDGLLAGVTLAWMKTFRPQFWKQLAPWANRATIIGLLTLALAIWLFWDRTGLLGNSIGWPVLSSGLALLVFAGAQRTSWLGARPVPAAAWIAAVSYSLYLIHKPIYHLVHSHLGEALRGHALLAFVSYTLAALLACALLHYTIERPGLLLRGRILMRWEGRTEGPMQTKPL